MEQEETYVPDTSVIIEGAVSKMMERGEIRGRIVIPRAVLAELESQANRGMAIGFAGLEEVKRIKELAEKYEVHYEVLGRLPRDREIAMAKRGAIDAIIRELAWELGAVLVTSDRVQAKVAEAMGVRILFIEPRRVERISIEKYFDKDTMSVHLKEGCPPKAKKGLPGRWYFSTIDDHILTSEELEQMANELIEAAKMRRDSFIEIDRRGSTIIQLAGFRIVITRPPLSDGIEITAVKPVVRLELEDYNLPKKLVDRIRERAEGILIAGAPGMGKTTFAQALAEFYSREGRIVKTIESPRDMQLPAEITQYSKTYATSEELHDILLLSRPDYTVFDEMRDSRDFALYTDLRLAGIGMIGVVHATSPIDAIQRFIGRVELGIIPSIIDTVIFIDKGEVAKVYEIRMTVKLPTGLREADLARPVIEVRNFLTGELEYEIYTFGEQTVVIPVRKVKGISIEAKVIRELEKLWPGAKVEIKDGIVNVIVPRSQKKNIGRKIRRVRKLEDRYGISIKISLET